MSNEQEQSGVSRKEVYWFLISSAWRSESFDERMLGLSTIALLFTLLLLVAVLAEVLL